MSTRENPTTVSVSPELLARALGLPRDARIVLARWNDVGAGYIDLDIVAEGWPECHATPTITEIPRQLVWKHNEIELGRREMRP